MAYNNERIKDHIETYLAVGDRAELFSALEMLNKVGAVGWWTKAEISEHISNNHNIELTDSELDYIYSQMEEYILNNWDSVIYSIEYYIDDIREWRKDKKK